MNASQTYLMNPHSGMVQSTQDWQEEGYTPENAELIEVVWIDSEWVEVK